MKGVFQPDMKDLSSSLCSDSSDMNTELSWKFKLPVRVGSDPYSLLSSPMHRNISSGLQKTSLTHSLLATVSKGFYSQLVRMRHKYVTTMVERKVSQLLSSIAIIREQYQNKQTLNKDI